MKKFSIEFKWAAIFMAISLLWVYLEKSAGLHDQQIEKYALYTNLFGIFALALYWLSIFDKKRNYYAGKMDWTRGFLSGLTLTVMIAILSPLTVYITHHLISSQFIQNMRDHYIIAGSLTPVAAEAMFSYRSLVLQGIFTILSMGVVTSAIIAWFARSKDFKP